MSNLDAQLKELQNRKLKSEFLKMLKIQIGNITDPKFKNIEKEIKDSLFGFVDAQIDLIEGGEITDQREVTDSLFSDQQTQALVLLANKTLERQNPVYQSETQNTLYKTEASPNKPIQSEQPIQDKIKFAMSLKHLDRKEVQVKSEGNSQGLVVGLDAPHVIVQLKTGITIKVPPGDLIY